MSEKRRRRRKFQLRDEILLQVAKGGQSSKSSLNRSIPGTNYPDVNNAVDDLEHYGLLLQKGELRGIGKKQKFYVLTDSGIKQIIKLKITVEDFWELVFFVFDETTGHELKKFTVDNLFSAYEKDVLMLPREQATPLYDLAITYFQYLKKHSEKLEPTLRVLLVLAKNQPLSIKEILKKLRIPESQYYAYYSSKQKSSAIINEMITFLLINKSKPTSKKYRLSHFGVLLLLTELFEKTSISRQVLESFDINKIIRWITINYEDLFPMIFRNWNILSKILTEEELVRTFRMVLNYEESLFSGEPLLIGGLYELFSILKSMRRLYQHKLEKMLEVGMRVRDEWIMNNKEKACELFGHQTAIQLHFVQHSLDKLVLPNSLDAVLAKIVELATETTSYDLKTADELQLLDYQLDRIYKREAVRQTLADLITFLFYTLLIYQIRFRLDILWSIVIYTREPTTKERDDINKITNNWMSFLDNNAGFMESYSKWISPIVEFETRNIDLIKRLSDFSIKSSEEQREQNLYFARQMLKSKSVVTPRNSF